ncbi:MAG: cysteine hydrolase family protein [Holophagaceae bacterium]
MKDTALLLIDVQRAFDDPSWGPRNNPGAEANLLRLLDAFRAAGLPVVHVKHDSIEPNSTLRPDRPGNALKPGFEPRGEEPLFGKTVNSAFIGTGLEAWLRERGLTGLIVGGFITNHCVSTSARMAGNLGFRTLVVADGCATFDFKDEAGTIPADTMHRIGLAELRGEFAEVLDTEAVLARLAAS